MYGRHAIIFPLAVLILLAGITLWIDRTVQAPQNKADGSTRHDPDYIVNNFVTTKTDINGNIQYILAAVEMKHYPDDDSTHLVRPRLTQCIDAKPYTQIESLEGLVSSNGETVQFIGNVKLVRQATKDRGEMVLRTQYLKANPDAEVATTDRPVVITEAPKTVVNAVGMIYDKKKRTIQLLNKVRTHYEKPKGARNTGKSAVSPVKAPAAEGKTASNIAPEDSTAAAKTTSKTSTRRTQ